MYNEDIILGKLRKNREQLENMAIDMTELQNSGVDTAARADLADNTTLYSCAPLNNVREKLRAKQALTIVCHGDSMTWGLNTGSVQATNNYPAVLQSKLRYINGNNDINVINEGHSGTTSNYGLSNFTSQVLSHTPDLLIMMWGLNDSSLAGGNISMASFLANMRAMIKLAKQNGIAVLIATPVPIIARTLGDMYNLENMDYVNVMKDLAIEQGVELVDVYGEFCNLFKNNAFGKNAYDDSAHLSDYTIVADIIIADKLCDIYQPKHKNNDFIRFDTNQVYNTISSSGAGTGDKIHLYYSVANSKPTEKIKFLVYSSSLAATLDLLIWSTPTGGNINIRNFDNIIATFSGYSSPQNYNAVASIPLNGAGLYCIELIGADVETAKYFTSAGAIYRDNIYSTTTPPPSYTALTLQNSWVNNSTGFATARYIKDGNNVRVSGLLKSGTTTLDTVIANLPTGYRPIADLLIPTTSYDGTNTVASILHIKTNGDICVYLNCKNTFLLIEFGFSTI